MEKLKTSPAEIHEIFLAPKSQPRPALAAIEKEAVQRGIPMRRVEMSELDRLSQEGRHQGVLAWVKAFSYGDFDVLLNEIADASVVPMILALDSVTDPGNFGAVLRVAEGAGVKHVLIPKDRSVGVTPAVVKSSAGAVHHLIIYRVTNLRQSIQLLKKNGYWAVGLDAAARESIYELDFPDKLVAILGSEGKGMRALIKEECDFLASIPMEGKVASLNVAVSGGIFLYELLRRKKGKSPV